MHREETGWASERGERVAARLQADRPEDARLVPIVLWIRIFTAFTVPGRYIYVARRLLERCADDESAAFLVAGEIAHHDLGDLRVPDWIPEPVRERGGRIVASLYAAVSQRYAAAGAPVTDRILNTAADFVLEPSQRARSPVSLED